MAILFVGIGFMMLIAGRPVYSVFVGSISFLVGTYLADQITVLPPEWNSFFIPIAFCDHRRCIDPGVQTLDCQGGGFHRRRDHDRQSAQCIRVRGLLDFTLPVCNRRDYFSYSALLYHMISR